MLITKSETNRRVGVVSYRGKTKERKEEKRRIKEETDWSNTVKILWVLNHRQPNLKCDCFRGPRLLIHTEGALPLPLPMPLNLHHRVLPLDPHIFGPINP